MKFRGHETFSIRKNWLAKGIQGMEEAPSMFCSKGTDAMDYFGIGRNMVYSLRYWLGAVGLAEEKKNHETKKTELCFTDLGKLIKQNDPFAQELGTLWLIQYRLATNFKDATSWYFFFNEFNLTEFTRDDFVQALQNYVSMNLAEDRKDKMPAIRSFEDDFDCILNTYVSRFRSGTKELDPEDNIDCPLAELGLLNTQDRSRKIWRKVIPPKQNIPPLILLAVLADKADGYPAQEIPLSDLQNKSCCAAKVFNLDTITLMDLLGDLENADYVKIVRTAGLDVVRLRNGLTFTGCVEEYYGGLKR